MLKAHMTAGYIWAICTASPDFKPITVIAVNPAVKEIAAILLKFSVKSEYFLINGEVIIMKSLLKTFRHPRTEFWRFILKNRSRKIFASRIQVIWAKFNKLAIIMLLLYIIAILISGQNNYVAMFIDDISKYLSIVGLIFATIYTSVWFLLKRDPLKYIDFNQGESFVSLARTLARKEVPNLSFIEEGRTFDFSCDKNISEISRVNHEAFLGSDWSYSLRDRIKRNSALSEKNPKTFALIFNPIDYNKNSLGITSVIPLTQLGYEEYVDGNIADISIKPRHIASSGNDIHALLIFFFAMDPNAVGFLDANRKKLSAYLLGHLAYHVGELASMSPDFPDMKLIIQLGRAWDKEAEKLGLSPSSFTSGDGFNILQANLKDWVIKSDNKIV